MDEPLIHNRALAHGLNAEDIVHAWNNYLVLQRRSAPNKIQMVGIGTDGKGRFIEFIAADSSEGAIIYHAITPPTRKVFNELGIEERKR